ncbi:MAG: chalcone isomerase family protein [Chitinophagales bacterium]|nr:chalcone isomerase family protein [Chitinophagales bacterium]
MKNLFILLLTLGLFSINGQAQVTVNNVKVPATIKGASSTLNLNGAGVRKKAFFKVYVLSLYVKNKTKVASAILNDNIEKTANLEITSKMVNSKNMEEAVREGFDKSLNGNIGALSNEIDHFIGIFKNEDIKVGDVFTLHYVPNVGLKASKNGKLLATVNAKGFSEALFGIWLGNNPVEVDLKEALLGK